MNLSPIIEALIKTGATQEMILAVVQAYEAEKEKEKDERRSYERERKRKQRMSRNVPQCPGDNWDTPSQGSDGFSLEPFSLTPNPPPKENPPKGGQKKTPLGFDDWYALYPHKVGRGAAVKAFSAAMEKSTLEELCDGVKRYISTKPPDRDWCNPATWLNQERWKDQPARTEKYETNRTSYSMTSTYADKPKRAMSNKVVIGVNA